MRALYWYSGDGGSTWLPLPEQLGYDLDAARKYRDHLPLLGELDDGTKVSIISFGVMKVLSEAKEDDKSTEPRVFMITRRAPTAKDPVSKLEDLPVLTPLKLKLKWRVEKFGRSK